jgi:phospholysine phosphohistidine inorganic pyrophosphate phosphatase
MQAILFDMDGVLYEGNRAITGAADTIAWCREQAIPHLFLTNTTSRPRSALVEKLGTMGISASPGEILTPPVAATNWLRRHAHAPAALFIPQITREEFIDIPVASDESAAVGAVVLGDLGEQWDFATYNRAFRLLMNNPDARLIALGMTRYWQAEDGPRLDVGPFVKGLEYAVGIEPLVMGKPAQPFFSAALSMLGVAEENTIMIGDDIRGDIEGAQQAGIHGVLVRTGKFRPVDLSMGITPDFVLNSIADLPQWWETHAG